MEAKYLEISGRTFYAFEEPDFVGPRLIDRPEPGTISTVEMYNEGEVDERFWRRQFGPVVTRRQRKWDWAFGVVMPAICFFFDPFIFRNWGSDEGMLAAYRISAYLLSGTAMMGLAAWLLWGERLKALNAPLAGLFFAAGVGAGMVGLPLIPMSLIGSIFIIGLLGFTPLFTSVVFLRNAVRAKQGASPHFENRTLNYVVALSTLAGLVIPWVINQTVGMTANPRTHLFPWW